MSKLRDISILGSGWLGLPLAISFQKEGMKIHLSTRSSTKFKQLLSTNIDPHLVDIENINNNIQHFLQTPILIINITCKQLSAYQNLLYEIEKSPIQHVLFISSTSVYPSHQGICKESDSIVEGSNLHCIEKLFMENLHFDCTVIRFAGLIGPKRHPGRFFITGKKVRDANAKVNLIHQLDCILLIKTVLEQEAWGEIFNGCADNHPTKKSYYSKMAKELGYSEPSCLEVENGATKVICNEKIKQQLGYQFIYPDVYQISC